MIVSSPELYPVAVPSTTRYSGPGGHQSGTVREGKNRGGDGTDEHETDCRSEPLTHSDTFAAILAEHGGMLWRTAGTYEADPQHRQDLYQEMLLAVWQALPRLREADRLRTYVARIAHNRGVSHVDRAVRRRVDGVTLDPDEVAAAAAGPEGELEAEGRRARLQAAVGELPLAWQQVITLTLEGFAPREVADVLGLSANVVSIRLTRAKQALARRLRSET